MVTLEEGIEASKVTWGGLINGQAREILQRYELESESSGEDNSAIQEAMYFLSKTLEVIDIPAKDIYKQAEDAGISRASIKRAKKKLGIKCLKQGMNGGWVWSIFHEEVQNMTKGFIQKNEPLQKV
jgi:DNA polymerase III delta prime subunit